MALLTVGAGALLLGPGLIGAHAAIIIDAVLWPLGTITGLASSRETLNPCSRVQGSTSNAGLAVPVPA